MTAAASVVHLVVGPDQHGVVRHASEVATACHQPLVRVPDVTAIGSELEGILAGANTANGIDPPTIDVVHTAFTDRLFGPTSEQASAAFVELAELVARTGAVLSVTLHDVPRSDTDLDRRRREAYRAVLAAARGVVTCSRVELAAVENEASSAHSLRHIALPVGRCPGPVVPRRPTDCDVVVLGFVYPDRGYEDVLAELPPGSGLLAVGRAAAGHEQLPEQLARLAGRLGRRWESTGFVPDTALAERLAGAAVPVAPNVRVGASGSIGTWLAHGRRPLVPRTEYTEELLARMPGSLTLYDPNRRGALRTAVSRALAEPQTTWLGNDVEVGPELNEVAEDYRTHFAACVPFRAGTTPARRGADPVAVPGNRWDLLPPDDGALDQQITVVIPYYDDQRRLDLVLAGLAQQSVAAQVEIVVADDGSSLAPDVSGAGELPVTVVRQARDGFGAARARNLGARHGRGDMLLFLDGDTVPEADYVERLVEPLRRHPDVLAVGRRRHADLDGWTAADVAAWLAGSRAGPTPLPEPAWLADAYRDTADLRYATQGAYRNLISAVLGVNRGLFERLHGFDETFRSYGGEDWEFANRAWHAGALFVHAPLAVAWHDGPHWADRPDVDHRLTKNVETLTLARLLPDPTLRGGGQWTPYPYIAVRSAVEDVADTMATARSAFAAGVDCAFWLTAPNAAAMATTLNSPYVHLGPIPADVLARAAVVVDVHRACDLGDLDAVARRAVEHGVVRTPALTARCTRAINRCVDDADVERLFGRHDLAGPDASPPTWLERDLPRFAAPGGRG